MNSVRIARRAGLIASRRNFSLENAFETKNTIKEKRQKFYSNPEVGAENPTYLKEPGDKLTVGLAFGGLLIGITCIFNGLYNMSLGINKKPM